MARSTDSSALTYAGIAIILLVAIAAVALFRFNLFDVRDMIAGPDFNKRDEIKRNSNDERKPGDSTPEEDDAYKFSPGMPDDADHRIDYGRELPRTVTVKRTVGDYETEVELKLVPQGWFIMGEDDGVIANMPKRWVWMDAYYLATTEMTNEQYYAFILDDGYRKPKFWSQEGYAYISDMDTRGSPYIGWANLGRHGRLTALAAPEDDSGTNLTLEVLDGDLHMGVPDVAVLVLPDKGDWSDTIVVDRDTRSVRMSYRDKWRDVTGDDVRKDPRLKGTDLFHTTDLLGRVDLSDIPQSRNYTIVAWIDGDKELPVFGQMRRGEASHMRHPKMPVVGVSWFEADACCKFFGGELPTEAQWEKAGRGTDGRTFPWGDAFEFDLPSWLSPGGSRRDTTTRANVNRWNVMQVGEFDDGVGPYGHHDMVGNVSEWCRDVYLQRPELQLDNPYVAGTSRDRRVQRGASTLDDDPQTFKLYSRRAADPYKRNTNTRGFRIVYDVETALRLAGLE